MKEKEGRKQIDRKHTKAEIITPREHNFSPLPGADPRKTE